MSTQQSMSRQHRNAHVCECGEIFESTEELLAHARDVHKFSPL